MTTLVSCFSRRRADASSSFGRTACAAAAFVLLAVLSAIGTPSPGVAQDWTVCAVEHQSSCSPPGGVHVTVRYGEQGQFVYADAKNLASIPCTNAQLGDPLYGVVKHCAYQASAEPGPFQHCADEGSPCNPGGGDNPRWVRYGAGDQWYYSIESNAFWCDNAFHNYDPIPNVYKSCQVGPPAIELPDGVVDVPWVHCAQAEGGTCSVTDPSKLAWIRYGFGDQWTYRRFTGTSVNCSLGSFGIDPYPNQLKVCEIYQEPDAPPVVCPAGQTRSGNYCLEPWGATHLPDDTAVAIRTMRVNRDYYGGSDVWQRFYGEVDGRFDAVDAELQPRDIFRVKTFSDSCCAYSFPWYRLEAHDGSFVHPMGGGRLGFGASEDAATLFARSKTWVNGAYVPQAFALAGAYRWSERFDFLAQRNFYSICQSPFNVGYGSLDTLTPVVSQWLSGSSPNFGCYASGAHEFFIVHEP